MSRKLEIELEKKICRKAAIGLLQAGFTVGVNDGEETVLERSTSMKEIMDAVFSTDEDYLYAYNSKDDFPLSGKKSGERVGWVLLIWGNVDCLISNYSVNMEDALKNANSFAEKYSD